MKINMNDIIMQNKIFVWIALATVLILYIPFLLMQFHVRLPDPGGESGELLWSLFDFVVMGTLLFSTGSLFVLAARKVQKTEHRIVLGIVFTMAFLLAWAELAVGIFGTPFAGS